jgi:3'(2'), 5'-bisphosphate nucleotidase
LERFSKHLHPDEIEKDNFKEFNTKDAVVWIDPLDGTKDFVNGNLPAVTVLIGLSIKGFAKVGIVHNPFSDEDSSKGRTIFGSVEHGAFRVFYEHTMSDADLKKRDPEYLEPFDIDADPAHDHNMAVAASLTHFSPFMQDIFDHMKPIDVKRIGGAGNKCLNVTQGTVDAYIHSTRGLKNWDLCANEPIIKAMGGFATDCYGQRLYYGMDRSPHLQGLVLAKSPKMHQLAMKRVGELLRAKCKF